MTSLSLAFLKIAVSEWVLVLFHFQKLSYHIASNTLLKKTLSKIHVFQDYPVMSILMNIWTVWGKNNLQIGEN